MNDEWLAFIVGHWASFKIVANYPEYWVSLVLAAGFGWFLYGRIHHSSIEANQALQQQLDNVLKLKSEQSTTGPGGNSY